MTETTSPWKRRVWTALKWIAYLIGALVALNVWETTEPSNKAVVAVIVVAFLLSRQMESVRKQVTDLRDELRAVRDRRNSQDTDL